MREWIKRRYYNFPLTRKINESVWAHVFHDSIKKYTFFDKLSLNVGRFSANYTLLYLLHRIIDAAQPEQLLEIGLGESSKLITTFLKYELPSCNHIIVENNREWIEYFSKFKLSDCTNIELFDIKETKFRDKYKSLNYINFDRLSTYGSFSLIIIDGPNGTKNYSRNDVYQNLESLIDFENFIIIFDDTDRLGEHQTFTAILNKLRKLGVAHDHCVYYGDKFVSLVYSTNYSYLNSL